MQTPTEPWLEWGTLGKDDPKLVYELQNPSIVPGEDEP